MENTPLLCKSNASDKTHIYQRLGIYSGSRFEVEVPVANPA